MRPTSRKAKEGTGPHASSRVPSENLNVEREESLNME